MSGGVDSSVSAYLLKESGFDVIGLFMKNWDDDPSCPQTTDYEDVLRVCEHLDIPCYSINFAKEYKDQVFSAFLDDLKQGLTPNPDILCNKYIKFDVFYKHAKKLGADYIATGHYAQLNEQSYLIKGKDPNKDQTYFLHQVKKEIFKDVLFPVGNILKPDLRKIAQDRGIPTALKKDSTGICFIGKRDFRSFTAGYLGYQKGPIVCIHTGKTIAEHEGAAFYTLGQRKGLKIGGPGDAWFVVDKDIKLNILFVAQGDDHPRLYHKCLKATDLNWLVQNENIPQILSAKVRYRQEDQPCKILNLDSTHIDIEFDSPQRAITMGQSVVFYDGDICLGGGKIIERF